ncbi:MAG TPA: hypothetical protein VK789_34640 [Bryobacteraceae bacterium]|jgi:hypothetical protein|nr:hypothetical protein [Bryobacteraceae bacterium]
MKYHTLLVLLLFAGSIDAQTPPLSTVDVDFQVHYLGPDTVLAKYGRKLPKTVFAGSVTGTNKGNTNVVFGQGYVIQVLRSKGFLALSQQDAKAIVLKSQGTGVRGVWNKYSPVVVKILDDIEGLQVMKVINFGAPAATALVTADAIAKVVQPDVSTILAQIYQDYDTDGIQPLMQLPPGGSLVGTLLFEAEGAKPAMTGDATFTIQVPVLSK